ncbi:MAG: hypothetical protein WBX25_28905, partial [Rhodomicrobium sp.]
RIEIVLRTLPFRRDRSAEELESRIAVAAGELTRRAKITLSFLSDPRLERLRGGPSPSLDKRAADQAVRRLASSLDSAIHTLAFLPEPVAVALAGAGLMPEKAQQALEAMLKSVDGAYLSFAPEKPGRPPSPHLQQILIDSLGATYFDLTGKRPTVSTVNNKASGIFYNFTLKMLQAMRLEKIIKPESAVRRLCQVWRKRRPSAAIKSF